MKKQIHSIYASLLLCVLATPALAEEFYLIRVTDPFKNAEMMITSKTEYAELSKRIRLESMNAVRAHRIAEKRWKEGENEGRYPGRGLAARQLKRFARSTKRETLEKKLATIEASKASTAEKKKRNQEKWDKQGEGNTRDAQGRTRGGGDQEAKKQLEEKRKRQADKAGTKMTQLETANTYYQEALDELINKSAPKAQAAE